MTSYIIEWSATERSHFIRTEAAVFVVLSETVRRARRVMAEFDELALLLVQIVIKLLIGQLRVVGLAECH